MGFNEILSNFRSLARLVKQIERTEALLLELQNKLEEATKERIELQEETEIMMRRLIAADKLITGLNSEKERWAIDLVQLKLEQTQLIGNCLLSSAFLAYAGKV